MSMTMDWGGGGSGSGSAWQDAFNPSPTNPQTNQPNPASPTTLANQGLNPGQVQSYQNFQNFWNAYQPLLNQAQAGFNQQAGSLGFNPDGTPSGSGQLGISNQYYSDQSGFANQNYQQQLQGIGLDYQQLGIQQGDVAALGPYYQSLNQLAQQGFGLQNTALQQQQGEIGQQYGISEGGIQAARQSDQFNYAQQLQQFLGGQAARGATSTVGTTSGKSQMDFNLQQQLGGLDRQQQQLDLTRKEQDEANQRGFQQLGISEQQQQLQYGQQQHQVADQLKGLDIANKRLGLTSQELTTRFNQALSTLGYNQAMSAQQIYAQLGALESGQATNPVFLQALSMLDNAGQLGNGLSGNGPGGSNSSGGSGNGGAANIFGSAFSQSTLKRVDQGQDLQLPMGSNYSAPASGHIEYHSDPNGFGAKYPVLIFDSPVNGQRGMYFGHQTSNLPPGAHINAGQVIGQVGAGQGNANGQPGWMELGWWDNGPTGDGQSMHKWLTGG